VEGYFLIYRSLCESSFWLGERFTYGQAWIDLIYLASFKDTFIMIRGIKVEIKRGQVGIPSTRLAERWRWSRDRQQTFINRLQILHQIIQQKTRVTSIITILNYEKYQDPYNKTYTDPAKNSQKPYNKTGNLYKEVKKKNNNTFIHLPGTYIGKSDYIRTAEEDLAYQKARELEIERREVELERRKKELQAKSNKISEKT
jgi:hypothetical protein